MTNLINSPETGLLYRKWAVETPQAVLLLVHGIGAHSERWNYLAEFFQQKNVVSYAIELQGFGENQPTGDIPNFEIYFQDIIKLRELIRQEHPQLPVFLSGESMGGLIVYNCAFRKPEEFTGLIALSPAFKNRMKFPFWIYPLFIGALIFKPKYQIKLPFRGVEITADKIVQDKLHDDKRELRYASVELLFNIVKLQFFAKYQKDIPIPVLFQTSGQDTLVDTKTSIEFFKRLIAEKKYIEYPDMKHALSIEQEREKVFTDMYDWLKQYL
jgi:alpha-beta hydrolase superfamily lysophospholipase